MSAVWILVNQYEDGDVFIGPFFDEASANEYMEGWPDDEDLTEQYICPLNDPTKVGQYTLAKEEDDDE